MTDVSYINGPVKTCSKCGVTKGLDDFQRRTDSRDGYRDQCRACRLRVMADYRQRNLDTFRARDRERQRRDRVAKAKYLREYYRSNLEKRREYLRANPQGNRLNQRRRRALKRGYRLTADDRAYMRLLITDPCAYCGGPGGTIDHIEPLSITASGVWSNLTAACHSCNSGKNAKPILVYLLERRWLSKRAGTTTRRIADLEPPGD